MTDCYADGTNDVASTPQSSSSSKPDRTPGTTIIPVSRVKRVVKEDKDISIINAEATFCITYATELFMEYLVQEGFTRARNEKRKTIFYKDLASAVSEVEQFEFLEDVIPHTMTLKTALERRKDTVSDMQVDQQQQQQQQQARKKQKTDHSQDDGSQNQNGTESTTTAQVSSSSTPPAEQ
ncbi:hypothetical protein O0I10_005219 [Lichtheimia ornata]|uniref:Transcription factor CBF/NF-Y/archaeal histone domain-containing protein n=1 Tax=Lichtheimia ornata TaxID=688661 RepID=A0AAD7XYJ2_9FUNG|nr:uncharacterized protein O0I10_005219 [Lichtheimia ornata]KAJ8659180.1 hypothetical protein O0I10_005219 [Lichtheimia ornata]